MNQYEKLKELVESIEFDTKQFFNKGNSAAGTRVRKALQQIKSECNAIRIEIQEIKQKQK